jgi:hypothetical protein
MWCLQFLKFKVQRFKVQGSKVNRLKGSKVEDSRFTRPDLSKFLSLNPEPFKEFVSHNLGIVFK